MKKKYLAIILSLIVVLVFVLSACGESNSPAPAPSGGGNNSPTPAPAAPAAPETSDEVFYITAEINYPEPAAGVIVKYFEDLTELSGGRLQFDSYFGSSLSGQGGVLQSLESNITQIVGLMPYNFDTVFPYSGSLFNMPFLGFEDMAGASAIWKEMYDTTPEMQAEYANEGLWVASVMANPIYDLHLAKDANVRLPQDMKGLTIITQVPEISELVTSYGAAALDANPSDFYPNLEKGVADGIIQHVSILGAFGVAPDLVKKQIRFDNGGGGFVTSILTYVWRIDLIESMPQDLQDIIYERSKTLSAEMLTNDSATWENTWARCEEAGNDIVFLTKEEVDEWKKAAEPIRLKSVEERAARGATNLMEVHNKLIDKINEYYKK